MNWVSQLRFSHYTLWKTWFHHDVSRKILSVFFLYFYRPLYTVVRDTAIRYPKRISVLYPWKKNLVTSTFSFCSNSKRRQGYTSLQNSPKTNKTFIYFKHTIHDFLFFMKSNSFRVVSSSLWVDYKTSTLGSPSILCFRVMVIADCVFFRRSMIRIMSKSAHWVTFLN